MPPAVKPVKNGHPRSFDKPAPFSGEVIFHEDAPLPKIAKCEAEAAGVTPGFWLRAFRFFRALYRKRLESAAIKAVRLKAAGDRRDAARQYAMLEEQLKNSSIKIKELEGRLRSKEITITHMEGSDIPKLKDKIEVLEYELSLWVAVHERNLTREKAEIAMNNERIVPRDEATAFQRRMEGM